MCFSPSLAREMWFVVGRRDGPVHEQNLNADLTVMEQPESPVPVVLEAVVCINLLQVMRTTAGKKPAIQTARTGHTYPHTKVLFHF